MLYHLGIYLTTYIKFFNLFHYVSFRAIGALLGALFFSFLLGDWFIAKSRLFFRAKTREWTPQNHKAKGEMPTMGGILILAIVVINALLWCDLTQPRVWIFLAGMIGFGLIGLYDDVQKIKRSKGISARTKSLLQILVASLVVVLFMWHGLSTEISFPFFKNLHPNIGYFFILWAAFIIIGCSNAVNLTDGLDGLAIGSLICNFAVFAGISYLSGHVIIAEYLHIPYAANAEGAILGSALLGASIGFLWYNAYPAQIFMGDVGSLSLGAALAFLALLAKQELLLVISGGLFVVEALSVILQVGSFRYFGKRIFKMAPLHHHFELLGWPETKITVRFGIISLILSLIALITLKIR